MTPYNGQASSADRPPEPKRVTLPRWPGWLAHTRAGDPAIYVQEEPVLGPDDPVDLRCGHCLPRSEIAFDDQDRRLIFIVHHQAGCAAIRDRLQMAGAR
jgi:hypothetical protein